MLKGKHYAIVQRGAFCNTFAFIKLLFAIKIFILSIFEWSFNTGFAVCVKSSLIDTVLHLEISTDI